MNFYGVVALVLLSLLSSVVATDIEGKRWAILVAGSNGYGNYRHQADVCHAYQVLKKGGLKDENIIVFMYDDIAFDTENPRPGTIINKPYGTDVYYGVPKDYCGENATADNLYAVILGNKSALTGGSGKVLESGPDDYVFIYYSDHGSPGLVGMPSGDPVYAKDLIDVLKKKHEANSYKSMVIYIEACESGSMFEGILPENWNIYGVTASNASQSSFGTYCPFEYPSSPSEYGTCLGDLFSIAWLEDSDKHDLSKEAFAQQYQLVRRRTGFDTPHQSQVEQYGDKSLANDFIFKYIGTNPANDNITGTDVASDESQFLEEAKGVVNQRDASLVYLRNKFNKAPKGSHEKLEAKKKLLNEISDRKRIDRNINNIISLLFGRENGEKMVETVRPSGQPLVDDWGCLKMLVKVYEEHCGSLSTYGRKYTRAMANMCNLGIDIQKMIMAANRTCVGHNAKTT